MITPHPNGRFKCNTRLCLSITDFHPDTWDRAWSVSTILTGLPSFMVEKGPTLGSIETSDFTKRQLAAQSLLFNLKGKVFCELFPEVVEEIKQKQKAQDELSSRHPPTPTPWCCPYQTWLPTGTRTRASTGCSSSPGTRQGPTLRACSRPTGTTDSLTCLLSLGLQPLPTRSSTC
uniref:UBC core domain-containing protein n=1 Tax=Pipistrellus kuhlii TaxID=59472 RepID=A0A7J7VCT0_PIPKU|nr:hypothetical protein mPipKuh1_018365 [Pipistrellus kuhlii]